MIKSALVFVISLVVGFWFMSRTGPERDVASTPTLAQKLLRDSLRLFDLGLRDPQTGQYLDTLNLDGPIDHRSSSSATGFGLITLALGDRTGNVSDGVSKALLTLRVLLGQTGFRSQRARSGWFRHWYDARTGIDPSQSEFRVGYSTIETAILAAGAKIAGDYFAASGKDPQGQVRALAEQLIMSVDWSAAVHDVERGQIYMLVDGTSEQYSAVTDVFNEYILVACMGAYAESRRGRPAAFTTFWDKHFRDPAHLPTREGYGRRILTDDPKRYLSSFAVQYPNYLCGDVINDTHFRTSFNDARVVDSAYFATFAPKPFFWGSGAGEVRYRDAHHVVHSGYHADAVERNDYQIVSPSTIAGFLPVYPDGLADLEALYADERCVQNYGSLKFLWRCSLRDLSLKFARVQAVDFAMMALGLSTLDTRVGIEFFSRFAPAHQQISASAK